MGPHSTRIAARAWADFAADLRAGRSEYTERDHELDALERERLRAPVVDEAAALRARVAELEGAIVAISRLVMPDGSERARVDVLTRVAIVVRAALGGKS